MTEHNYIIRNDIADIVLFIRYNSSIETCDGIPVLSAEVELMKYTMTVKEASGIWHISEKNCASGMTDTVWVIPIYSIPGR